MSDSPSISPQVGTRLLFENDRVRVWDLRLEPGQSSGLHRHSEDYFYVVIGDGHLQGIDADGAADPVRQMRDGDVRFNQLDGDAVHEAVNRGDSPWRNIVVELKEPATP
ncbi:MAG: cupin domain-containing protein [Candidatus Latescibacteria bacterium]|nr:cupin domain-containing protein [Candidatus Latescibacterota bacterium]